MDERVSTILYYRENSLHKKTSVSTPLSDLPTFILYGNVQLSGYIYIYMHTYVNFSKYILEAKDLYEC